jgi:hypothetical protein
MIEHELLENLNTVLTTYQSSFRSKEYLEENDEHDLLMDVFSITPEMKRENRQYWGRELGMCWQLLIIEICKHTKKEDFGPALRFGLDEPCDLVVGQYAIDTKYRIGSGDSGTLKKFKAYGPMLRKKGYQPMLLILRTDNLRPAIKACEKGQWDVLTGADTLAFIRKLTKFDLGSFLRENHNAYLVERGAI